MLMLAGTKLGHGAYEFEIKGFHYISHDSINYTTVSVPKQLSGVRSLRICIMSWKLAFPQPSLLTRKVPLTVIRLVHSS